MNKNWINALERVDYASLFIKYNILVYRDNKWMWNIPEYRISFLMSGSTNIVYKDEFPDIPEQLTNEGGSLSKSKSKRKSKNKKSKSKKSKRKSNNH